MSKASKIVVLCEDRAHEVFACRFLKKGWGIRNRDITIPPYPAGKGSGKQFVEDRLASEVKALRQRQATSILIVMRDADEDNANDVLRKLETSIHPERNANEPIVFAVPKWHIQTWIAYLEGQIVDESNRQTYKNAFGTISETKQAHEYVDKLADWCRKNQNLQSPPKSLMLACKEFERIRSRLRNQ